MVESENALIESIKKKGDKSYYYAHAPRNCDIPEEAKILEGVGIVTGGPPRLIASKQQTELQIRVVPQTVNIRNYSWTEDDDRVSIYIEFGEDVISEQVDCTFDKKELVLTYNFNEIEIRKLILKNLRKEIVPEESRYRIRKNKITVHLKKAEVDKWYSLVSN